VHLVPDEGVDSGPVIVSETVDIAPTDTLAEVQTRMHAVEHRLLVAAIDLLIERG
jgi:phosphoribosylglycinamide formyltransferase-1